MHGTLNHLLATDRIWMKRFTGEGEAPERLDAILHDRLADLVPRAPPSTGTSSPGSIASTRRACAA